VYTAHGNAPLNSATKYILTLNIFIVNQPTAEIVYQVFRV
jgi:hypothetical protein